MNLCELLRKIATLVFPPGNTWFYYLGILFFIAMCIIWWAIVPIGLAAYVGYGYLSHYYIPDVSTFAYYELVYSLNEIATGIIKLTIPFFIFSFIFDLIPIFKERGVLK